MNKKMNKTKKEREMWRKGGRGRGRKGVGKSISKRF